MKNVPRDLQFQCIPKNDRAVVFLHGLLNRQSALISHKKLHFPMQSQGIAKVLQNSFDFTEKIVAKALQSLGFAKVLQSQGNAKVFYVI